MNGASDNIPDSTAVRVALWRALHVQYDSPPHILKDEIGYQLAQPDGYWQDQPDMDLKRTSRFRAAIVARARYIEDLVIKRAKQGLNQYVILGAGLDSFAQRRSNEIQSLQIFEIDKPETQKWKQERLKELGYDQSNSLHFVPVDFETESWWEQLLTTDFDPNAPALVSSIGVSQYLSKEATKEVLQNFTSLVSGSTLVMTFFLYKKLLDPEDQPLLEFAEKGAKASGTPFISFYSHEEMLKIAKEAGFEEAQIISKFDLLAMYFNDREDDLLPASGEDILIATI